MFTQIPVPASPPDPLSLPLSERLFYPDIYEGVAMLSHDKITSCEGMQNLSTNASSMHDRPGATIISPILLSVAGVAGHITALYYLYRPTKPNCNRSVFYILLTTLIWTDMFGKLITTPPAIVSYACGKWVGGVKLCILHGFCTMTFVQVTHFLVSAMALDRFLCIRRGYFYKTSVTKSRVRLALMSLWIFSILFCTFPLFGVGEYELQYPGTWCFVNIHVGPQTLWCHRLYTNVYGLMNICSIFTILICNVIVIGTLISARISRSRKLSAAAQQSQKVVMTQRELELQMCIVLVVITLVFLVSWSPLDIRLFFNQIWPHTCREEHIPDLVSVRLASFNQIMDPWAYIICRKVFSSRVWRSCRTIAIGKNSSSRQQRTSINIPELVNFDVCGSSRESSSSKRKCSLPTPNKYIAMTNCSIQQVNDTNHQLLTYREELEYSTKIQNQQKESTWHFGSDLGNGCPPYIPLYEKRCNKGKDAPDIRIQMVQLPPFPRKQFCRRRSVKEENVDAKASEDALSHSTQSCYTRIIMDNSFVVSEWEDNLGGGALRGRRNSWSCSPSIYKHYRTTSTQTLEAE